MTTSTRNSLRRKPTIIRLTLADSQKIGEAIAASAAKTIIQTTIHLGGNIPPIHMTNRYQAH